MAAYFKEKTVGAPGYGANVCYFYADVDVKEVNSKTGVYPLFVIPAGVTIVATKATTIDGVTTDTTAPSWKVGSYVINADGTTGAAVTTGADDVFTALAPTTIGTVVAGATGSAKLYATDTVVGLTVATQATGITGKVRIEMFGVC